MRLDQRPNNAMRPLKFEVGYLKNHPGSVLVSAGDTKILCVVSSENRVPAHRLDLGGWLSAEYNMLPGSTLQRKSRSIGKSGPDGRSIEISRLIGRSLRQAINLDIIGQRSINIDCDVIQADAGTRCAAISASYVALCAHIAMLIKTGQLKLLSMEDVIIRPIAAVSLGLVNGEILCDLSFQEDSKAQADCNLVGSHKGQIIEFQCSAEQSPLSKSELDHIYELGQAALEQIMIEQNRALMAQCGIIFHR